jgi:tetratricopeptide (TPR) repeat protein
MKKITLLVVLFSMLTIYCKSQYKEILRLDRRFVHCINKWVVFSYDKTDNSFAYGYVYQSNPKGISLRYMGTISIDSTDKFISNNKFDSLHTMMTIRLSPEKHKGKIVGIIPNDRLKEIGVQEFPDEYKFYKNDTVSVSGLYNRGFLFNAWEECNDALFYLQKAYKLNSNFEGLSVELAYSYNCLEQYDKAAEVLKDALKTTPDNCYYYKELVYSLKNSNNQKEAEEVAIKGISICNDNLMRAEMAFNIAQVYYKVKDKSNLKKWLDEAKKYPNDNKQLNDGIKVMEAELNK